MDSRANGLPFQPVTVDAAISSFVRLVMRYLEMKSSRLTGGQRCQLLTQDEGVKSERRTVSAAHASLAGESGPSVQYTPVVENYFIYLISSGQTGDL